MLSLIGFPDFLYNDTELDQYYENFTLDPTDHYALQVEKASIWAQKKAFRRLVEDVDREEFGTSSAVVNAFYSGVKNAISQWIYL
jgi:predicted metalloendopeptidase